MKSEVRIKPKQLMEHKNGVNPRNRMQMASSRKKLIQMFRQRVFMRNLPVTIQGQSQNFGIWACLRCRARLDLIITNASNIFQHISINSPAL